MKRDLGLIRLILLEAEDAEMTVSLKKEFEQEYGSEFERAYSWHKTLLIESGLVKGNSRPASNGRWLAEITLITWAGYEYLDSVRDDEVWRVTKSAVNRFGSASLEVVKQVAAETIKKMIFGN